MVRGFLVLLILSLAPLFAVPIVNNHPLQALAEADVLVVGRVVRIDVGAEVFSPEDQEWQHPVFEHIAEVELLRFHAGEQELHRKLEGARFVRIAYRAEHPLGQGGVFSGPLWPQIRKQDVRVFALKRRADGTFRLWFDEGQGAVPPAYGELQLGTPAPDALAFLQREAANALASGDPAVSLAMARYLGNALTHTYGGKPDPLLGLTRHLPSTHEAAAALLASGSIPRASLAGLLEGRNRKDGARRPLYRLTAWILERLPEDRREPVLIETLLRRLPVYSWGAVGALREFGDHPALEAPLASAIAERRPCVLLLLEALIRDGRSDLIPDAMAIVRERLEGPIGPELDWQAGARLLWDHGSAQDFERLFAKVREAQQSDPALYRTLWNSSAYYDAAPRQPMLRFLSLYLADARNDDAGVRYSDIALGALSMLKGDRFGLDEQPRLVDIPIAERDAAIQRAAQWLAQQLEQAP